MTVVVLIMAMPKRIILMMEPEQWRHCGSASDRGKKEWSQASLSPRSEPLTATPNIVFRFNLFSYFGDNNHGGKGSGPWIMADLEVGCLLVLFLRVFCAIKGSNTHFHRAD